MNVIVSIVIANYNYGRYLESAIDSVLAQCARPICFNGRNVLPIKGTTFSAELIICDACSSDGSVPIIKRHENALAWWCSEKDGGQSEAFNKGFRHSSGEWLTWLNADELLCKGVLRKFCKLVSKKPAAQWVSGNYLGFDDEDGKIRSVTWGPHANIPFLRREHTPFPVFGPTSFWRRDVYNKVGPIDERLHYAMDFDYWQRLTMAGVRQTRLNCVCWAFRIHRDSKTSGDQSLALISRRKSEMEYIKDKTGYDYDFHLRNPYYILWLMWRVFDGSLLIKPFVKLRYIGKCINRHSSVQLLCPYRLNDYQFYMQWFSEAWSRSALPLKNEIRLPWNLKLLIGKLNCWFYTGRHKKKLLVCSGGRPEYFAWPWCYFYEIVPVIWDCWPKYWSYLARFVRKMRVKTIFLTSSIAADYLRQEIPSLDAVWLPEGIDCDKYHNGGLLIDRNVDILELGRQYKPVHEAIIGYRFRKDPVHLFQKGNALLFPDLDELVKGLSSSKIVICYPRCDTHPEQAGRVETMTQRYWECMLSGALIAGRAPQELIDFCGYNPVIELGNEPAAVLDDVLQHIEQYQALADKNFRFALENASWDKRIDIVKAHVGI